MKQQHSIKAQSQGLWDILKSNRNTPYVEDYGSIKEYYLVEEIGEPQDYVDCFHEIRNSRDTDTIKIYINCPGGNLFTTIQFLQVLSETKAHVIVCVEGACMSAATLIFLMGDEYIITDYSMFMFHNYSGGTEGKGAEMYHGMIHQRKWSAKLFKEMYQNFLTEQEIAELLNDKDLWLDAQQVIERLKKRCAENEPKDKKTQTSRKNKNTI
jgi:ATP-dependent protease ClpP protease subunit